MFPPSVLTAVPLGQSQVYHLYTKREYLRVRKNSQFANCEQRSKPNKIAWNPGLEPDSLAFQASASVTPHARSIASTFH